MKFSNPAQHTFEDHPSREQLKAFAADSLSPIDREHMCGHIGPCAECREFLALITPEEGPPPAVARLKRKAA